MKQLNGNKMRLVIVGFVAATMLGGGSAKADFTFGEPTNLGPVVNSSAYESGPSISGDGLALYYRSYRGGGYGESDLWLVSRSTKNDTWGEPMNLGPVVNTSYNEGGPSISFDGLTLYFYSNRPGGSGVNDIYVSTRETIGDPWSEPVNLGPTFNSSAADGGAHISADGLSLFFNSRRLGDNEVYVSTRATTDEPWGEPANLGQAVNSSADDRSPCISTDGLRLFLTSRRPGGYGDHDLYVATRATRNDPWGEPTNLGPTVNSSYIDSQPSLSVDGRTLYFDSNRPGGIGDKDLWQASIEPIVDLNGDGIVDAADRGIMVDHWGEDYPLCDIGPMPWGDGIVDMQDLLVLIEYLEPIDTLIAHWALDETEGITAHDSVSDNDDIIMGDPLWQPAGGKVDGALELDGVTNCIIPTTGPNPAEGPFSIFAWIKGGAPGQVIISQPLGSNWLEVDADGMLMTELKVSGNGPPILLSQAVITDDQWHHIGLVWDGSQRMLCADGVVVAEDTPDGLEPSAGGLYIGVGNNWAAVSFFSGLIDDVRIYRQALSAEDIAALAQ